MFREVEDEDLSFLGFSLEGFSRNFGRVTVCKMRNVKYYEGPHLIYRVRRIIEKAIAFNAIMAHYYACLDYGESNCQILCLSDVVSTWH